MSNIHFHFTHVVINKSGSEIFVQNIKNMHEKEKKMHWEEIHSFPQWPVEIIFANIDLWTL